MFPKKKGKSFSFLKGELLGFDFGLLTFLNFAAIFTEFFFSGVINLLKKKNTHLFF